MKITKTQIDMVSALPDDALKKIITGLASSTGFDLSGFNASPAELERVRAILRNMTDADISRAAQILKNQNK